MNVGSTRASLPAIITCARAGAVAHAWRLFNAGGYDQHTSNPSALAVKGRLLKDQALLASGAPRQALLEAAITSYSAANQLVSQPYTQINIATLHWLAGHRDQAVAMAKTLLLWLERDAGIQETPYYLAATRAEAWLLCGDLIAADKAMAEAVAHDPDGWDDRASTLRQLRLVLEATAGDTHWLDQYRPPRSLHYAGHLGIAESATGELRAKVDAILAKDNIGFGYGTLAAGSDLIIAEAIVGRGGDLHVVLPASIDTFISQSVLPFGTAWLPRFEACLAAAASVRTATSIKGAYEPLATALAADFAMGAAVLNANHLESEAAQLLIIDEGCGRFGTGINTSRDGERWARLPHAQQVLAWPRIADVPASGARSTPEGRPDRRLAALVHIAFDGIDTLDDGQFAEAVDDVIMPLRTFCATLAIQPVLTLPIGNARILAFETVEAAWQYVQTLLHYPLHSLSLRIAGHYALAHWLDMPPALTGRAIPELTRIANAAIPGVFTVSEAMATALFATAKARVRAELVGEQDEIRLFGLTAA